MEFEGRTAIVTGAARGIGLATATLFAQRGGFALLVDKDQDAVAAAAEALRGNGLQAQSVALDLANSAEYGALSAAIDAHLGGRVDVLVNNAGGWRYSKFREIDMAEWEWMFHTNVTSMFLVSRAVVDRMTERKAGRIVNIASGAAHRPQTLMPHYAAAKAAVVSLTKSLALELAPDQVLVNAVSPGPIATETLKQVGVLEDRVKNVPLGRVGQPEDIAEVALFLASPRNRFVTGQTVVANGGMFMV